MIDSIYEKVCNEALIATITDKVSVVIDEKLEDLRNKMSSPYINGLKGLAEYFRYWRNLGDEDI